MLDQRWNTAQNLREPLSGLLKCVGSDNITFMLKIHLFFFFFILLISEGKLFMSLLKFLCNYVFYQLTKWCWKKGWTGEWTYHIIKVEHRGRVCLTFQLGSKRNGKREEKVWKRPKQLEPEAVLFLSWVLKAFSKTEMGDKQEVSR